MSAYETLLTSLEAGVTRITLNRPEVPHHDRGTHPGLLAFFAKREPEWKGR